MTVSNEEVNMTRIRNANRDKAFELYKKHFAKITSREISLVLGEKERNITYWKKQDKWKEKYNPKGGAPKGNKNAVGNKGGGAPKKNQNSRKEGWYSKYYPTQYRSIIVEAEESGGSPLEILWAEIITLWAKIIYSQKTMFVKDKNDKTVEFKKKVERKRFKKGEVVETYSEVELDIQQAWEKEAKALNVQSAAMSRLANKIKKYDDMLHADWDTVTEEQKLRVEKLKVQIDNPDLKHRKEVSSKKLQLDREKFEHQMEMDEMNNF